LAVGLLPGPLGELKRSPDLHRNQGFLLLGSEENERKGREGQRKDGNGKRGKEKGKEGEEKGKERKGKGRGEREGRKGKGCTPSDVESWIC